MDNVNDTTQKKRGRPATGRKTEQESRMSTAISEVANLPQFAGSPDNKTVSLINEAIALFNTPPVDVMDPEAVKQRTLLYLQKCAENCRRPAVAAYALYLGIPRLTLNSYYHGQSKAIHPDSLIAIKWVYSLIDGAWEQQMSDGDMNVVAGIFLMRNNLGYTNVDTVEIVPKQADSNTLNISDVIAEYDREDK